MVAESAEFTKATQEVKNLAKEPSLDQQKELYGLFKFGKGEKAQSSMIDIRRRQMYNAYKAVEDSGITPEQAQKKYVEMVERLKNEIGTK